MFEVLGFIDVKDPGEASLTVSFPIRFFERPNFAFGFELAENQSVTHGSWPTASGIVQSWTLGRRGETGAVFYTGATLLIVTTGDDDLAGTFHYRFQGGALVGA